MTLLLTIYDTVVQTWNVFANATYCHEHYFMVVVLVWYEETRVKECNLMKRLDILVVGFICAWAHHYTEHSTWSTLILLL